MAAGPDFICVGMQKAGTGWLFDQLQFHPDFWMPPAKEIHYLDRDPPLLRNVLALLQTYREKPRRLEKRFASRRRWGERDVEFLEEAASLSGKPLNLDSYAELFRFKGDCLSGDITPGYSGMDSDVIEEVGKHFPDIRIVFLVRDPVARAWSQICMTYRNDDFDTEMLKDPVAFGKYLRQADKIHKVGFPTRIAEMWSNNAPNTRFQHFFFDDIAAQPAEARRQILTYIGADPEKSSGEIPPDHNKKSQTVKLPFTDVVRSELVKYFTKEIRACAQRFGGHALTWAANYGIKV
jgi:hypothetical protein